MALQGTIDSFPLTEVLTLLASSKKSGRLALDGDRGSAALWISDGDVVGGDMVGGGGATAASLLFEMLRFTDASFAFDAAPADSLPQHSVEATPLAAAMDEAATLLTEWDDIVAVVPSLAHRVVLVDELPDDSVTLDAASWSLVIAAAADPVVAVIGDALGLDEFGACAAAASLVERGLATMTEPASHELANAEVGGRFVSDTTDRSHDDRGAGEVADHPSSDRPSIDLAELSDLTEQPSDDGPTEPGFPERFPIDDLLGGDASDADDTWGTPERAPFESPAFDGAAFDGAAFDGTSFDGSGDSSAQVDDARRCRRDPMRGTTCCPTPMGLPRTRSLPTSPTTPTIRPTRSCARCRSSARRPPKRSLRRSARCPRAPRPRSPHRRPARPTATVTVPSPSPGCSDVRARRRVEPGAPREAPVGTTHVELAGTVDPECGRRCESGAARRSRGRGASRRSCRRCGGAEA